METVASTTEMSFIADQTNYYEEAKLIMKKLQKKLKTDEPLRGKARALELIDYLIKHGTMRIVHEIADEKFMIKSCKNTTHLAGATNYVKNVRRYLTFFDKSARQQEFCDKQLNEFDKMIRIKTKQYLVD